MKKLLQLKLYSLLSTKWGMCIFVVGLFFTFNSVLQIMLALIEKYDYQPVPLLNGTTIYKPKSECFPEIDVVYTWVNGSDPRQQRALRNVKLQLLGEEFRPCNATEDPGSHNCTRDEEAANRYNDNEELRYSLRSLEKHAPWIRNIYLVTNGQIPYWLNLNHPRINVIQHKDIFVNKSHLPTFSSPAIEVHIHRIPGLSDKFLYFNDDTMLGSDVWPDDWYTQSGGQKVYLAWAVPNCAEGCPPSWVGDGYCDIACNVSACNFDGGDCRNYTGPVGGNSWTGGSNNNWGWGAGDIKTCAPGCPDSWIGDKYCDRACKNKECGYDAGDCEIELLFNDVYGVSLSTQNLNQTIELPKGIPSVYFNLSGLIGDNKIVDGSHDNADLVRTATISQKHKVMTLTFHRDIPLQEVMISIVTEVNGQNVESIFNITVDTSKEEVIATNETVTMDTNSSNQTVVEPGDQLGDLKDGDNGGDKSDDVANGNDQSQTISPPPADVVPNDAIVEELPIEPVSKQGSGDGQIKDKLVDNDINGNGGNGGNDDKVIDNDSVSITSRKLLSIVDDFPTTIKRSQFSSSPISPSSSSPISSSSNSMNSINVIDESNQMIGQNELDARFIENMITQYYQKFKGKQYDENDLRKWVENGIEKQRYLINEERKAIEEIKKQRDKQKSKDVSILQGSEYFPERKEDRRKVVTGRKLLDMYGDSLKFVNNLLNEKFGAEARKVPAHMPHMIDKHIVDELQKEYNIEFDETSSNQLRSPRDMQYAFSYFYWVMSKKIDYNLSIIWYDYFDTDKDGYLSDNEIRTLSSFISIGDDWIDLKSKLLNCSYDIYNTTNDDDDDVVDHRNSSLLWRYNHGDINKISIYVVQNCPSVNNDLESYFKKKKKYRSEQLDTEDVAFLMIGTNATNVQRSLDGIRERRQKFICLNDNINHSNPHSVEVIKVMKDFYEALFPIRSSFELPPGVINEHLYIDDLLLSKKVVHEIKQPENRGVMFIISIIMFCIVCILFTLLIRRKNGSNKSKRARDRDQRFLKLVNV